MRLLHVVGARPNFMKAAPVLAALGSRTRFAQMLVHTGQHYDSNMSEVFFQQLELPAPDVNLDVGSGTQTSQTAQIMLRFEEVLLKNQPDIVFVYGDVNSTVAAALVCAKRGVKLVHVEAGLRSSDRSMPEEINRLVTDQLADVLFTPSEDGDRNLIREGIASEKIHFVGNVMIDTLVRLLPKARVPAALPLKEQFALVTLHRPSNVDSREELEAILQILAELSRKLQVIFPVHPRTRRRIVDLALDLPSDSSFLLIEPLGYLEFLALQKSAAVVITDSGGVQEETTFLGVPCLTLRENTERPVTVEIGTNVLVGREASRLPGEVERILAGGAKKGRIPPLWDGKAGERIAEQLLRIS